MVGQAIISGNFKKRYEKPIRFWFIVLLTHYSHVYTLQSTTHVFKHKVVYRRFFQFWFILPNQNYQSCSIEYNFNRCCHHTLHLKEKTFSIFENLLKTSRTTTKVLSCLKTSLTIMRVDRQCDLSLKRRIIITCNISSNEVIYFI